MQREVVVVRDVEHQGRGFEAGWTFEVDGWRSLSAMLGFRAREGMCNEIRD
jgi:hypothetical protein